MKKLLLILLFCLPLYGRGKLQGWCENGNKSAYISNSSTTSPTTSKIQQSFPSCTVTVYAAGTLTVSTIYADMAGTAKANPFTAASSGQWFFYADDGSYDVQFSGGGISTPFTRGDFSVGGSPTTVDCSKYSGANAGAKINTCIAALPSTGGVADARLFTGAQTATAVINVGSSTKPVQLLLEDISLSTNSAINVAPGSWIKGSSIISGGGTTITYTGGALTDFITITGIAGGESRYSGGLLDLNIDGGANATNIITFGDGCSKKLLDRLYITGTGIGLYGGATARQITHNVVRQVLFDSTLLQAVKFEILNDAAFIEMNSFYDVVFRNRSSTPQVSTVALLGRTNKKVMCTVFTNPDASFSNGQGATPPAGSTTGTMFDLQGVNTAVFIGGECQYNAICIGADSISDGVFVHGLDFFDNNTNIVDNTPAAATMFIQGRRNAANGVGAVNWIKSLIVGGTVAGTTGTQISGNQMGIGGAIGGANEVLKTYGSNANLDWVINNSAAGAVNWALINAATGSAIGVAGSLGFWDNTAGSSRFYIKSDAGPGTGGGGVGFGAGSGPSITWGAGAPSTAQPQGSIYIRTNGALATTIYVYHTGWNAVTIP